MDAPDAFFQAFLLIVQADPALLAIVGLSLRVTLTAVVAACVIGMPLGALLAVARFPGRGAALALVNGLMGLPPVVAGLAVYLLLSRSGPLGPLGLLYTPAAMIVAQTLLVAPIVAALTCRTVADLHAEYDETLRAMGANRTDAVLTVMWDARFALVTAALAGFGRALAEVGAVMMVGGNIAGHTRVMTTTIALETSRGALALALGLGTVLLLISIAVSAGVAAAGARAQRLAHV